MSRRIQAAALGLVLVVLGWMLAPVFVVNAGNLYLRDLLLGRAVTMPVPWIVRERPFVKHSVEGTWLGVRVARLLERRASPEHIDVPKNAPAIVAEAYAGGRLSIYTRMEAEIVAASCVSADAPVLERCRSRLASDDPAVAVALSPTGVVTGEFVDELNIGSGRRLGTALVSGAIDCRGGLEFLREWIRREGFQAAQLEAARHLSDHCSDSSEASFYRARAADLSSRPEEARAAYERSDGAHHPEAKLWMNRFLSNPPDESAAFRQAFPVTALQARFEDGSPMGPDTMVADAEAPWGRARRGNRFGAVLGFGPYITLPSGRYRISFYLKTPRVSAAARVARLDVREDTLTWRPYFSARIVSGQDPAIAGYQRFDSEFTSTGEGSFSVAVITLSRAPVSFAGIRVERVAEQ